MENLDENFYTHMLEISESQPFLNYQVVSERLHRSLIKWIETLFLPSDLHSVAEHMKWQQQIIGDAYARITEQPDYVNKLITQLSQDRGKLRWPCHSCLIRINQVTMEKT